MKSSLIIYLLLIINTSLFAFPTSLLQEKSYALTWASANTDCSVTLDLSDQGGFPQVSYIEDGANLFQGEDFITGYQMPRFRSSEGSHAFLTAPNYEYTVTIYPKTDDYSVVDISVTKASLFKTKKVSFCRSAVIK